MSETLPFGHAKCDVRWSGLRTCHCAGGCCKNFVSETAFMKHIDHRRTEGQQCRTPEESGLVDAGRAYECWRMPGSNPVWED